MTQFVLCKLTQLPSKIDSARIFPGAELRAASETHHGMPGESTQTLSTTSGSALVTVSSRDVYVGFLGSRLCLKSARSSGAAIAQEIGQDFS